MSAHGEVALVRNRAHTTTTAIGRQSFPAIAGFVGVLTAAAAGPFPGRNEVSPRFQPRDRRYSSRAATLSNTRIGRRHVLGGEMNAGAAHIQRSRIADYMVRSHLRRFAEEVPHERSRVDTDGRVDRLSRASQRPQRRAPGPLRNDSGGGLPLRVDSPKSLRPRNGPPSISNDVAAWKLRVCG